MTRRPRINERALAVLAIIAVIYVLVCWLNWGR